MGHSKIFWNGKIPYPIYLLILLVGLTTSFHVSAEPPYRLAAVERNLPSVDRQVRGRASPLIERIQKGLAGVGLYTESIHGILDDATEASIRAYQHRHDLKIDGLATEKLAIHLETAASVKGLLNRLEQTREEDIESARQSLLNNPATRELLGDNGPAETADATRDPGPCFQNPTARCLLEEAAESAKSIPKDNMRDWALGELLATQARAGLADAAMITVGRIEDPRLVMVALREIAEAQAAVGRGDEALAATKIIPDRDKRLEALIAVASIHARRGDEDAVGAAVAELLEALGPADVTMQRIVLFTRAATVQALVGHDGQADDLLDQAGKIARRLPAAQLSGALRHVAAALAEMGRPVDALAVLDDVEGVADRTPVLIAAAKSLALAGASEKAIEAADAIEAVRYRSIVLCSIAAAHAAAGDAIAARELVERAEKDAESIKFPYARAFALSRIALVYAEIGKIDGIDSFRRGVLAAQEITDGQLRAHVLWTLASERRRVGDIDGATETEALAEIASDEIRSALSQVWMYSEIAVGHLGIGERDAAWAAFRRALYTSEGIDNAWARARALSKVAGTLIQFTGPEARSRIELSPQP